MQTLPFGQTLLLWREYKGMTQGQLAEKAGVSRPNLSAVERGKAEVSLRTLRAIAYALGVHPGVLVDGQPPEWQARAERLDRSALERIAAAVVAGDQPQDLSEADTVEELRLLTHGRMQASGRESARIGVPSVRAVARAWLRLESRLHPDDVRSLLQRIGDKARA
jgi:transcriptional regulator with XRE-family HTH domain